MAFSRSSSSSFIRSSGPNQLLLVSVAELLRRLLWRLARTLSLVRSRDGKASSEALKPRTREVGTREPRKRCSFAIFSLLRLRSSSGARRYGMGSAEFNELSWEEDGGEKGMGRLSSSINEGGSITSVAAAKDSSEIERASVGLLGKTK